MATTHGFNRNMGHEVMIDPYKEDLKEALYFMDINIEWLKRDSRYDPAKPTIWLQTVGLLETLHIVVRTAQNI